MRGVTSTVIKAGRAGPVLRNLSTFDLADHLAKADAVIAEAKRRAAAIVSATKREAAENLKQSRESGYKAGHKDGYEEGARRGHEDAHRESIERFNKQQVHVVAAMQDAIAQIDAMKEDLRLAAEKDLIDFAVSVAGKLTFAVGRVHREAALDNLRRALPLVASRTDLTIRVHPDDIASMETFADSVLTRADASRVFDIVPDDTLAPGGCKVLSGQTEIDATLETQVAEMVALLADPEAEDV
ncbi:MAG: FliH/SctL family protein [Planctomycetota bacterium]|jgi:flagellar assembly protein FliH